MKIKQHDPVLLQESLDMLAIEPNETYVDATLGRGGHSSEILKRITGGKLFSFDQDLEAVKEGEKQLSSIGNNNYQIIHSNFKNIVLELALNECYEVKGVLFDLGVSSPQLDRDYRGFSYKLNGKLDMRMNIENKKTAEFIINNYSINELAKIFYYYGGEKFSFQIAKAIEKFRSNKKIETTFELVDIIKSALPQKVLKKPKHPAKKVFQALRIEANDEIKSLEIGLAEAVKLLKHKGRLVVITFHSLEDRIVKNFFKRLTTNPEDDFYKKLPVNMSVTKHYQLINSRPIKPSNEEINKNSRSRSAQIRGIIKL